MTSSALSQQLAKLEREIGQPLLVKRGRGVQLTDAGRLLTDRTAEIVDSINRTEAALQAHLGQVAGRMAIAAFATATRSFVPAALRRLTADHPLLQVESHEHEPADAIPLLDRGDVDIAVIDEWFRSDPVLPEGIEAAHLLDDVADLAVPVEHELADSDEVIDLRTCAHEDWISWHSGEFGHDWLSSELQAQHPNLHFAHTAGEHQSILALVEAGLGIALMPRLGRGAAPDGVAIKPLSPTITRRCFVLWRTDTAQRPAVAAAVEALTEAASAVAPDVSESGTGQGGCINVIS